MKNPLTDTHLGIGPGYNTYGFAEVRQRAKEEYIWRKARRDKQEKVPKYKIGERVVLRHYSRNSNVLYVLVEIVDFDMEIEWSIGYYGVVLRSTTEGYKRLGRLLSFRIDSGWHFNWYPANVPEDSIKWCN